MKTLPGNVSLPHVPEQMETHPGRKQRRVNHDNLQIHPPNTHHILYKRAYSWIGPEGRGEDEAYSTRVKKSMSSVGEALFQYVNSASEERTGE